MANPAPPPGPVDITDLRRRLGEGGAPISQAALAAKVGTSQPHICRLEKNPSQQKGPIAILLRNLDAETPEPRKQVA